MHPEITQAIARPVSPLVPRAVISGALVTLAVTTVLTFLAGGFGLMSIGVISAENLREVGPGLGIWIGIAWIIAATVGGYVAALGAGSPMRLDGMLNGFIAWAIACVVGGSLAIAGYLLAIPVGVATADAITAINSVAAHWGFFLADGLAAVGALVGGALGARWEAKVEHRVYEAVPRPV